MVRKLKTATRHKENPQPELDTTQIQQYNDYWSTLYHDDEEIGENEKTITEPPGK